MMLKIDDVDLIDADQRKQIWQPLSPSDINTLWNQVDQHYHESTLRWSAFCNALCLKGFLDWVAEDEDILAMTSEKKLIDQVVSVLSSRVRSLNSSYQKLQQRQFVSYLFDQSVRDSASLQAVLNGVLVTLYGHRLALIPCEAIEPDELLIPQEWVDIPELTAEYYLAIALNLDDQWLRMYGYASHDQVKQKAKYNSERGLYSLADKDLHHLSLPWLTAYLTAIASESVSQSEPVPQNTALPDFWTGFMQDWQAFGSQIWQGIQSLATLSQPALAIARSGNPILPPPEYHLILGDYIVTLTILQEPIEDPILEEIRLSLTARVTKGTLPLPENLQICLEFQDELGSGDSLEEEILASADAAVEFPELLGVPGAEFSITLTLADLKTTKRFRL
jgi:hypothetical protein